MVTSTFGGFVQINLRKICNLTTKCNVNHGSAWYSALPISITRTIRTLICGRKEGFVAMVSGAFYIRSQLPGDNSRTGIILFSLPMEGSCK